MVSYFEAIVLGTVQGLTEFLPISSSAHLAIIPWMLRWRDPGLAFDVALHLGTLLALLVYYRREWARMARSIVWRREPEARKLLGLLAAASVPGAIVGLAFEHQAETIFRTPVLIAVSLSALGIVLWAVDWAVAQRRAIGEIGLVDAILIGLSQALAIVPGVSRSGATITTGRILAMQRQDAANFSFLMATPIIAGAGIVEARKLLHTGIDASVVVGFIAAALSGWVAIYVLINFVRTRSYAIFAWYRLALTAIIVAVYLARS